MVDLGLSLVTLMVLAVVVLLAVGAFTLLPFLLTVERAEQRGLDPMAWGAYSLVALAVPTGLALVTHAKGLAAGGPFLAWSLFAAVHLSGSEGARAPGAHR